MQQPGWYPDPSGEPGRFRFWDGRSWTTATTVDPATPFPSPALAPAATGTGAGPKTGVIVAVAAALVLVLIGVGGFWATTRGGTPQETASPRTPPATLQPVPPGGGPTQAPTMPPGAEAKLDCTGGNAIVTREARPQVLSTGVVYDGVPGWGFSFDPSYWTWLDDHTSLGAIRLDGGANEAGITLGGVRFANGFADQATAGQLTVECLEGTLSVEEPTRAGPSTTSETTLGGMRTFHTRVELTSASATTPLVVDIYVIDSQQGNKWAQLITFQRTGSEAAPLIAQAVASLRHV